MFSINEQTTINVREKKLKIVENFSKLYNF